MGVVVVVVVGMAEEARYGVGVYSKARADVLRVQANVEGALNSFNIIIQLIRA